jgi:hypothetical protein
MILDEFRKFALRGNVVDLAAAPVIPLKARRCPHGTSEMEAT